MKHQIPNMLTIIRFLMVPVFLYCLFLSSAETRIWAALLVFVVASFTDYLDGMLARKMGVISDFGKIMDPLADKLLVLSALLGLCWLSPFEISKAVFYIILTREVLITILREIFHNKGIVLAADKLGKMKTVLQMVGIIVAYIVWAGMKQYPVPLIIGMGIWFWLVAIITVISGVNYVIVLFRGADHD